MLRLKSHLPTGCSPKKSVPPFLIGAMLLCLWLSFVIPDARGQAFGPGNAINLDGTDGYVQATNGVYFSGDFTIEGWVFVRSYSSWSRLIDFANGPDNNNVYLALSYGTQGYPTMGVFTNTGTPILEATNQLPTNQWAHLAATLSGTNGTIYINGIPVASGPVNSPPGVIRTSNFIGRSNYSQDGYADAMFDEIRIWNVARTQAQIQSTMNESVATNTPNLVAMWQFNESIGKTAISGTLEAVSGTESALAGGVNFTNSGIPFVPTIALAPLALIPGVSATFNATVNPGNLSTKVKFSFIFPTNGLSQTQTYTLNATNRNIAESYTYTFNAPTPATQVISYSVQAQNSAGTVIATNGLLFNYPLVTTLADNGLPGSLRYLINNSTNGTVIVFATNGVLTLTDGEIPLTNNVTLLGPGATNLIINGNNAGSLFNVASSAQITLSGLTLTQALAGGDGGAIYNSGTLTLSNCIITGNRAGSGANETSQPGGNGGNGGGIFNGGTLNAFDCTLSDNLAGNGGSGSGLSTRNGPISTPGNGGSGGAIYNTGTATFNGCTFTGNSGGNGGADGADPQFFGNAGAGGAIFNAGTVTINLCTLDSNNSGAGGIGGGIYNSGSVTLTASTITRNTANTGGGVYNDNEFNTLSSLFADNSAYNGGPDYDGLFTSEGYNLVGNDSGSFGYFYDTDFLGTSSYPINPLIAPLADNGGPTLTVALQAGSPAIDNGDDDLLSAGITTDQRGFSRLSGAHVDIGAYETIIGIPTTGTTLTLSNQVITLNFSNTPYAALSILTSTNLTLPLSAWTVLGEPAQLSPGQFQFSTPAGTNNPEQFFDIRSP